MRAIFPTPAIDVWGLAIVMFSYFFTKYPFTVKCKTDNMRAISTLVGSRKLLNMI